MAAATRTRHGCVGAVLATALVAAGCGSAGSADSGHLAEQQAVRAYVRTVEPLRRDVNKLLDGADPILRSYGEHRSTATEAQRAMHRLERRLVPYVKAMAALRNVPPDLSAAHQAYARTYVLEDRYLRALVRALPERQWNRLPHTEAWQRQIIVAWRDAVAREAARVHVPLPHDIQIAGTGEITPSPTGES